MAIKAPDIWALVLSILALIISGLSYRESKAARLDAKRQAIRSDAVQLLNSADAKLEFFNCHFIALKRPYDANDPALVALRNQLKTSRESLSKIDSWSDIGLDTFRAQLNTLPSNFTREADTLIRRARADLSSQDLETVNRVCELDG